MKKLLSYIIGAALGLWLASILIAGVAIRVSADSTFFGISINQNWKFFILFGITLGLINYFIKPILDVITIPLRILTLGIFGLLINVGMIWIVDSMFEELSVPWFLPLAWTTVIIWVLSGLIAKILVKDEI
ncbi:MAG: phage holin family protein [bacterium]|nr:phage holin family protein [bacterium]